MIAEIEQSDGSYVREERGEPDCGDDFCDRCGDCLACYPGECYSDGKTGAHRWVIYVGDRKHEPSKA